MVPKVSAQLVSQKFPSDDKTIHQSNRPDTDVVQPPDSDLLEEGFVMVERQRDVVARLTAHFLTRPILGNRDRESKNQDLSSDDDSARERQPTEPLDEFVLITVVTHQQLSLPSSHSASSKDDGTSECLMHDVDSATDNAKTRDYSSSSEDDSSTEFVVPDVDDANDDANTRAYSATLRKTKGMQDGDTFSLEAFIKTKHRLDVNSFGRAVKLGIIQNTVDDATFKKDGMLLANGCQLYSLVHGEDAAKEFVNEHKDDTGIVLAPYVVTERESGEDHIVLLAICNNQSMLIDPKHGKDLGDFPEKSIRSLDWQGRFDINNCGFFGYHMLEQIKSATAPLGSLDDLCNMLKSLERPNVKGIRRKLMRLDPAPVVKKEITTLDRTNVDLLSTNPIYFGQ